MTEGNLNSDGTGDVGDQHLDNQGGVTPAWTAQLPDDLKKNETLTGHKTIGELGKAYLDLHGKSANAVQLPGKDATDEDRATFYQRLGRPDKPDGYQFEEVKLPEGLEYSKDIEKEFRKVFHDHGLSNEQAANIHKSYMGMLVSEHKKLGDLSKQYQEKTIQTLKGEWKDDYSSNVELATRGIKKAGELAGVSEDLTKFMNDSRLGDHPLFLKVFHAIGKAISEDTALGTGGGAGPATDVPRGPDGRPLLRFPSMEKT